MAEINFPIVCRNAEVIVPANPTPHEMKTLSDVDDQESLRFYYLMIMFYNNNSCPSKEGLDPVHVIRQALAKTLVYYYPFSGRLVQGPHNKLMLNCTAEGVLFVEADAAVTLNQLGDTILPPCPYKGLLVKAVGSDGVLGCPLLLLQVTRFKCGGFSVALRINHVISDAVGSLQFVSALSQIAKGASTPSILPIWERHLLTARRPPRITHAHPEYQLHRNVVVPSDKTLVTKSFSFGPEEIKAIRTSLPPATENYSNFDLITACLWRSRSRALQFHPDDNLQITCAVSLRGKNVIELPLGYYGNAVVHPAKVVKASALCCGALDYAVKLVREARMKVMEEDYSRSAIDCSATMGKPSIFHPWNFIVSDVSRLGFDDVDFGWGKPLYGGTMDGGTFDHTIYGRRRNREGEDVVVAAMALPVAVMERFENEVKRVIWEPIQRHSTKCNL